MRESRLRLIFLLALVLIAVVFFCVTRNQELEYRGKSLSVWVDHFNEPLKRHRSDPTNTTFWVENEDAVDAIRHIGTNAILYLLKCISYQPPLWRIKWYEMLGKVNGKPRDLKGENYRRLDNAADACSVFGPEVLRILREAWTNLPALYPRFELERAMGRIQAKARLTEQKEHTQ